MVIELLAQQVAGQAIQHDELLFEPELVVRGSTGTRTDPLGALQTAACQRVSAKFRPVNV